MAGRRGDRGCLGGNSFGASRAGAGRTRVQPVGVSEWISIDASRRLACQNPHLGTRTSGRGRPTIGSQTRIYPSNGTPSGGVQGNKISITIPWSNGSTGTFTGNIEPDGRVTGGTSRFSSNFQTTWISQKMVCADEAIEEGTNQGGPVVAPNAPETWKAINDVDIYDGSGDNAAVVGMLNDDEVVQVSPGCRPDIKCEVIGRGWVFGNHLAKI